MKFDVSYEYEDYREVFKHAFSKQMWVWVGLVLAVWVSFSLLIKFNFAAHLPKHLPYGLSTILPLVLTSDSTGDLQQFLFRLALFGSFWMILISVAKTFLMRRHWKNQPALQRSRTIEVTVDGVTVTDVHSVCHFTWPAFNRYVETRNLIVFFVSSISPIVIPKRCISDPAQQSALLAMAAKLVEPSPSQVGFAVVLTEKARAA